MKSQKAKAVVAPSPKKKAPKEATAEVAKPVAPMPPRDELDAGLGTVISEAYQGNDVALEKLVAFAARLNAEVSLMGWEHFAKMQKIAERQPSWPVNLDVHPQWRARTDQVMKMLGVGTKCGYKPPGRKSFDRRRKANGEVLSFLQLVSSFKGNMPPALPIDREVAAMIELPPLCQSTAPAWYECMISWCGRGYKRLCDNPSLATLGEKRKAHYAGTDIANSSLKGTILSDADDGIRERLRQAFRSVTGFSPRIDRQ